jgi:hypothetical protein
MNNTRKNAKTGTKPIRDKQTYAIISHDAPFRPYTNKTTKQTRTHISKSEFMRKNQKQPQIQTNQQQSEHQTRKKGKKNNKD